MESDVARLLGRIKENLDIINRNVRRVYINGTAGKQELSIYNNTDEEDLLKLLAAHGEICGGGNNPTQREGFDKCWGILEENVEKLELSIKLRDLEI